MLENTFFMQQSLWAKKNNTQQTKHKNNPSGGSSGGLPGKRKSTICSICLPLTDKGMRHLLEQLPAPMILLGNFNAHKPLWGSEKMSTRERMLEEINKRQFRLRKQRSTIDEE